MIRRLLFGVLMCFSCALYSQESSYYSYIENKGQWPDQVQYKCELETGDLFLEKSGLTYNFWDLSEIQNLHGNADFDKIIQENPPVIRGHVYKVDFLNANDDVLSQKRKEQPHFYNYFLGDDQSKWASKCHLFAEVQYIDLYENIDLKFHSDDFFLKYDFIVKKGGKPKDIQLSYRGMNNIFLENGRLIIELEVNRIIEQKPLAWQVIDGERRIVKCVYKLKNKILSFDFPEGYDKNYDLIIDPELIFSTYSGSTADNFGYTATYDSEGFLYSGSSAFGSGYPNTTGFYQEDWAGGDGSGSLVGTDIAISKYDTTGTFMIYSTYLGGESDELPHSLIVDQLDRLYVFGTTSSPNFPTTTDAYSEEFNGGSSFAPGGVGVDYVNGSDIIVAKFNADGTDLLGSTFVGGEGNDGVNTSNDLKFNYADEMRGEILIDTEGFVIVASCTYSDDFPVVDGIQGAIAGQQDACLFKMTNNLQNMIWSTYLGGSNGDAAYSLDIDSNNDIYVGGGTESTDFYSTLGTYQPDNAGGDADGFILKILSDGSSITNATYYGSSVYDQLYFVEIDDEDNVYVFGQTSASGSIMIENANYGTPNSGMLVSKFPPNLNFRYWSTVFGTGSGKPNLSPTAFLVDDCGRVYLSGWGGQTNVNATGGEADYVTGMDVTDDAYQDETTGSDFYLLVLDSDADNIIYGSFFGGNTSAEHVDGGTSRFSPDGTVYQSVCAGCGNNDDFPIFPADAVSSTNNSNNCNNGVFKLKFEIPLVLADFIHVNDCIDTPITFVNQSQSADTYEWDFGDSSPVSTQTNPTYIYENTGFYDVQLIAYSAGCDVYDTTVVTIEILESISYALDDLDACNGSGVVLGPDEVISGYEYNWESNPLIGDLENPNPEIFPTSEEDFTLLISHGGCVDTVTQNVDLVELSLMVPDDIVICDDDFVDIEAIISVGAEIIWSDLPDLSNILNDNTSDTDIEPFVTEEQTFYAQATIGECEETDEVTVSLLADQAATEPDVTACANDTVVLSVLNPNSSLDYSWSPGTNIISGQNTSEITVVVTENITYTVTVELNADCIVTDEISVFVSGVTADQISATADPEIIFTGESSQLTAEPAGLSYTWLPPDDLNNPNIYNPLASPDEDTWYLVDIADGECVYLDSVLVRVADFICGNPTVYVPNAFTPNSNNQNEVLYVRGNNLTEVHLAIFDRWGQKIFETYKQEDGWDGTYKGEELDPAVFVYYLDVVCGNGETYFEKGNISLIR